MRAVRLLTSTVVASLAAGAAILGAQNSHAVACDVAALQAKAPGGTTITAAGIVDAKGSQPRYCQVDGHAATPGNEVNFRLGLPENWNGKFYFVGVGGTGGAIGRLDAGLERGYASASTDTGHVSSDETWTTNAAKRIDYGYRGTHATTEAAKALTSSFYGRAPAHSYFQGCSNGGRQAMMEVQRYPTDFDGVIAGDPAPGMPLQLGRALVFQKLLVSKGYVPIEKVQLLSKATVAACDASDGLKDGLVSDPRSCAFKLETLKCSGADAPSCLTQAQLDVVQQMYGGAKLATGETYSYGLPLGHEAGDTGWRAWTIGRVPPSAEGTDALEFRENPPNGFRYSDENFKMLRSDLGDSSFSWRTFDLNRDLGRTAHMSAILSPLDPDLRTFKGAGGKLLMYHGWADPAISAYGTVAYYDRMTKTVGGQDEAQQFARLFMVPGMHHCSGGPGPNEFDMLTALESWVEKGTAPTSILATHTTDGKVDRTRPLCAHPQVAVYKGSGSIDDAANFRCAVK